MVAFVCIWNKSPTWTNVMSQAGCPRVSMVGVDALFPRFRTSECCRKCFVLGPPRPLSSSREWFSICNAMLGSALSFALKCSLQECISFKKGFGREIHFNERKLWPSCYFVWILRSYMFYVHNIYSLWIKQSYIITTLWESLKKSLGVAVHHYR